MPCTALWQQAFCPTFNCCFSEQLRILLLKTWSEDMSLNPIHFRHNETFDKLNYEGFEMFHSIGFVCVSQRFGLVFVFLCFACVWEQLHVTANGCDFIFALTCEIASRFAFVYINLYVLCVSILEHTVWIPPLHTQYCQTQTGWPFSPEDEAVSFLAATGPTLPDRSNWRSSLMWSTVCQLVIAAHNCTTSDDRVRWCL